MTDQFTERLVVALLGLIGLAVVIGAVVVTVSDRTLPGELWTLGGTAIGGLGAILARVGGAQQVVVANQANDPVPVADVPADPPPVKAPAAGRARKRA